MIRIMVFQDRPEALLVVVPEGSHPEVQLPSLRAPFTRADVAMAMGQAGIDARVSESVAGRWSTAVLQAKAADKAERAQRDRLRQASDAAVLRGPGDIDRSKLIERKLVVDAQIRETKGALGSAKSKAATHGMFTRADLYRGMESKLAALQTESLAIQVKLGDLKKAEKARNVETWRVQNGRFEQRFIAAARELLDEETLEELMSMAQVEDDEDAE